MIGSGFHNKQTGYWEYFIEKTGDVLDMWSHRFHSFDAYILVFSQLIPLALIYLLYLHLFFLRVWGFVFKVLEALSVVLHWSYQDSQLTEEDIHSISLNLYFWFRWIFEYFCKLIDKCFTGQIKFRFWSVLEF